MRYLGMSPSQEQISEAMKSLDKNGTYISTCAGESNEVPGYEPVSGTDLRGHEIIRQERYVYLYMNWGEQ